MTEKPAMTIALQQKSSADGLSAITRAIAIAKAKLPFDVFGFWLLSIGRQMGMDLSRSADSVFLNETKVTNALWTKRIAIEDSNARVGILSATVNSDPEFWAAWTPVKRTVASLGPKIATMLLQWHAANDRYESLYERYHDHIEYAGPRTTYEEMKEAQKEALRIEDAIGALYQERFNETTPPSPMRPGYGLSTYDVIPLKYGNRVELFQAYRAYLIEQWLEELRRVGARLSYAEVPNAYTASNKTHEISIHDAARLLRGEVQNAPALKAAKRLQSDIYSEVSRLLHNMPLHEIGYALEQRILGRAPWSSIDPEGRIARDIWYGIISDKVEAAGISVPANVQLVEVLKSQAPLGPAVDNRRALVLRLKELYADAAQISRDATFLSEFVDPDQADAMLSGYRTVSDLQDMIESEEALLIEEQGSRTEQKYPIGFFWTGFNGETLTVDSVANGQYYISDSLQSPRFRRVLSEADIEHELNLLKAAQDRARHRKDRKKSNTDNLSTWRGATPLGCTWKPIESGLDPLDDMIEATKGKTLQDAIEFFSGSVKPGVKSTIAIENSIEEALSKGQEVHPSFKGHRYLIGVLREYPGKTPYFVISAYLTRADHFVEGSQCYGLIQEIVKKKDKGKLRQVWAIPITKSMLARIEALE